MTIILTIDDCNGLKITGQENRCGTLGEEYTAYDTSGHISRLSDLAGVVVRKIYNSSKFDKVEQAEKQLLKALKEKYPNE